MGQDCVLCADPSYHKDPPDGFFDSPFPCAIPGRPQSLFIYLFTNSLSPGEEKLFRTTKHVSTRGEKVRRYVGIPRE